MKKLMVGVVLAGLCVAQGPPDDKLRYERLAALGKLWTFVKYFHPRVASDSIDWDAALITAIDKTEHAATESDYLAAVSGMLDALHDPATRLDPESAATSEPAGVPTADTADGILTVRFRDGDYMACLQAVRQMTAQFSSAKAIVFDLRGTKTADDFLPGEIAGRIISKPGRVIRRHSGYTPPDGSGSGGYYSEMAIQAGIEIRPVKNKPDAPVVFLVDKRTMVPRLAMALQNGGNGAIVSEDPIDDSQAGVTETVALTGNRTVSVRTSELYYPDGTTGLTANQVLGVRGDDALQTAAALARTTKWDPPAARPKVTLGKAWRAEIPYSEPIFPDLGHRLLTAFRVWGVYTYFHPYKHLTGEDWDAVLLEFLPKMADASDARSYHLAVAEMVTHSHDTHCFMSSPELSKFMGVAPPPVEIRWIEERPVIVRLANETETRAEGLELGDVIVRIQGQPVSRRIDELSRHIAASTPQSLMSRVMQNLLNGNDGSTLPVSVVGADGKERDVAVKLQSANYKQLYPHRTGEVYRLINNDIGYMDLERLPPSQVDAAFEKLKQTKAIIMDMRGYPQGTAWSIAPRLGEKTAPVAAEFRRNVVAAESIEGNHIVSFVFEQRIPVLNQPRYLGKTVMLIDERAISQSEHSGLFYKTANGTTFIGSGTTGANGDVTWFPVPGGIRINFSGHDVRWPDGRQLQRVGLVPDVEVRPTIAGIRAGKDEVLDRAVAWLSSNISALPR